MTTRSGRTIEFDVDREFSNKHDDEKILATNIGKKGTHKNPNTTRATEDLDQSTDFTFFSTSEKSEASALESRRFSMFGATDCGEPSVTQQLKMDFTPIPGLDDNDVLVEKLASFWAFVQEHPELEKMLVLPGSEKSESHIKSISTTSSESKAKWESAMAILEENDMQLPPVKFPAQNCLLDDVEAQPQFYGYDHYNCRAKTSSQLKTDKLTKRSLSKDKQEETDKRDYNFKTENAENRKELKKICMDMDEFDQKHPKSFLSPTVVPLVTSVMQRHPVDPQSY